MKITNIIWDTKDIEDIFDIEELKLPTELEIPDMDVNEIANYLSDKYGWLVASFDLEED